MKFNFLNNIKGLLGTGNVLGVDIGTASIKVVEVAKTGDSYKLLNYGVLNNYGHFNRINEVIQTSTMQIFDKEAVRLIKLVVEQMGTKSKDVIASIPVFSAFVTLMEVPNMTMAEIGQTIQFKARQFIPMPIEEVTLDWLPVGERSGKDGKVLKQVLLVAVPTERIKQYKSIFKQAGLNLKALEVEALSNARSLVGGDRTPTLILDIGSHSSAVLVVQDTHLKVSNQIDYAGSHLTHALSKGLNINLKRAEELKKQKGLLGAGGEFELSTIMFPFVDVIIKEAKRVKERYEGKYESRVERIMLVGGGANLPGLAQYAEKQMGMPVLVGNPLLGFSYDGKLEPAEKELGATLSVALGLAIRK